MTWLLSRFTLIGATALALAAELDRLADAIQEV